ncbi:MULTISPECIES: BRO family protein [unclassified Arsenophonus]|uniref:BRO-N domain-containing protein n=1 Tax=unclassified Arsenophonus TaxID=2627083 RepID=UPI0028575DC8|nr:BRO family protein [Arsenophonus sp.]MDR5611335.1 BRO family protein [Arsenophonus sp.]MDR5615488.1 BRO family protein [Arsenophonus sp.]
MTKLIVNPFAFENHQVRIVIKNNEPWFVAQDICNVLKIVNSRDALSKLDNDEKDVGLTDTLGGQQSMNIISESGMCTLVLRCRDAVKQGTLPHRFRKWVTNEVLPSIRKTGKYEHPQYQPEAHEKFTTKDTQNLARIIALMTQNFRFKDAWNNAIWYALREVTGIPSPYPMEVRLVPSIATECERIWQVTEALQDKIADAEKTAIKRIIRKRENADKVIAEIETLLFQAAQDNQLMLNGALSNWHKAELTHFLQRC